MANFQAPTSAITTGTGTNWSNPTNIFVNDGAHARVSIGAVGASNLIRATNFNFTIGSDQIFDGVLFRTRAWASGASVSLDQIQLVLNGSPVGTTLPNIGLGTTETTYTTGASANTYGNVLTGTDLSNQSFGVQFRASNGSFKTRVTNVDFIELQPVTRTAQVSAAFTATPLSANIPATVSFTFTGTNAQTYSWDFGDGDTSAVANPVHQYTSAGTWTVSLQVSGFGLSDTETKVNYITTAVQSAVANFTADQTTGIVPLTVTFTDQSLGSFNSEWSWDFGDGDTSAVQNPVHQYNTPGTYTVTLSVSGRGGADTEVKTDYITVINTSVTQWFQFVSARTSARFGSSVIWQGSPNNVLSANASFISNANPLPASASISWIKLNQLLGYTPIPNSVGLQGIELRIYTGLEAVDHFSKPFYEGVRLLKNNNSIGNSLDPVQINHGSMFQYTSGNTVLGNSSNLWGTSAASWSISALNTEFGVEISYRQNNNIFTNTLPVSGLRVFYAEARFWYEPTIEEVSANFNESINLSATPLYNADETVTGFIEFNEETRLSASPVFTLENTATKIESINLSATPLCNADEILNCVEATEIVISNDYELNTTKSINDNILLSSTPVFDLENTATKIETIGIINTNEYNADETLKHFETTNILATPIYNANEVAGIIYNEIGEYAGSIVYDTATNKSIDDNIVVVNTALFDLENIANKIETIELIVSNEFNSNELKGITGIITLSSVSTFTTETTKNINETLDLTNTPIYNADELISILETTIISTTPVLNVETTKNISDNIIITTIALYQADESEEGLIGVNVDITSRGIFLLDITVNKTATIDLTSNPEYTSIDVLNLIETTNIDSTPTYELVNIIAVVQELIDLASTPILTIGETSRFNELLDILTSSEYNLLENIAVFELMDNNVTSIYEAEITNISFTELLDYIVKGSIEVIATVNTPTGGIIVNVIEYRVVQINPGVFRIIGVNKSYRMQFVEYSTNKIVNQAATITIKVPDINTTAIQINDLEGVVIRLPL